MNATDQRIARILLGAGLINDSQLRAIDNWQQQWGGKVHQIAVDQGFADEAQVAAALARGLNMPRVELATTPIEPAALNALDRNFCEENAVIPVALRDNGASLWAAVSDPTDLALLDRVRARARVARVMPGVAGHHEIIDAVRQNYGAVAIGVDSNYGIEFNNGACDEEFKVTNVAGSTIVKHVPGAEQLRDDFQPPLPAAATRETEVDPRSVYIGRPEPALDPAAVFAAAAPVAAAGAPLTPDQQARLDGIRRGLQQSSRALTAIAELCVRKGIFSGNEWRARNEKNQP